MTSHFIKTRKRPLVACLTCPICHNLLREATTICECLHTFCRECIYQKLVDEETYCCPICDVYLGCVPVEKLRPDNNLQDAGFPSRTKAVARKAAASRGLVNKLNCGREVDDAHDHSERLDSSERSSKMFMLSRRQRNSGGEPSNDMADDDIQNSAPQEVARQRTGKAASWEPLACLAEAANRTETSQLPLLGLAAVKTEEPDKCRSIKHANGMKRRVSGSITSSRKKESSKIHPGTNSRMARKLHAGGPDRVSIARKRRSVAGASENGSSLKCERRSNPVWFALLASENQVGDNALPQIPKCYLRIKDGNVPVSYVKKYLVKKLDLKNESEVSFSVLSLLGFEA